MKPKNKYYNRSHISEAKFRQILKEFCRDSTAYETSDRLSISRKTINNIYYLLRLRINELAQQEIIKITTEVEIDESYFGARRVRGKRGRGANGKTPVFFLANFSSSGSSSEFRRHISMILRTLSKSNKSTYQYFVFTDRGKNLRKFLF